MDDLDLTKTPADIELISDADRLIPVLRRTQAGGAADVMEALAVRLHERSCALNAILFRLAVALGIGEAAAQRTEELDAAFIISEAERRIGGSRLGGKPVDHGRVREVVTERAAPAVAMLGCRQRPTPEG